MISQKGEVTPYEVVSEVLHRPTDRQALSIVGALVALCRGTAAAGVGHHELLPFVVFLAEDTPDAILAPICLQPERMGIVWPSEHKL